MKRKLIAGLVIGLFMFVIVGMASADSESSIAYVNGAYGDLATVNLDTGVVTDIGPAVAGDPIMDIAMSPDGQLYGLGTSGRFYSIDKDTGVATLISQSLSIYTRSLGFGDNGVLFSSASRYLISIDTATGNPTTIGSLSTSGTSNNIEGIVSYNGNLYLANEYGLWVVENYEQYLDGLLHGGIGDLINSTTPDPLIASTKGLAIASDGTMWGFSDNWGLSDIFQITHDINAGTVTGTLIYQDADWGNSYFLLRGATMVPPVELDPCDPDETPPTIIAPPDITLECDTAYGALEYTNDYGTPTGEDTCSEFLTYGTNLGAQFNMGDNEVIWTADDESGNRSSQVTQIVTVVDTIAPSFTPPADIIAECVNGFATVDNGLDTIWATDVCNGEPIFVDGEYGEMFFTVGSYNILWAAADFSGNLTSYTQTITVEDTTAPSFTPPSTITTECVYGGTPVDLGSDAINATDVCDGDIFVEGDYGVVTFPGVGPQEVLWEATDAAGNMTSHAQTINITDNFPPEWYEDGAPVVNHQILSFECTSPSDTEIDWSRFYATDNCDVDVDTTISDPGPYPLNTHKNIEWSANDDTGKYSSMMHWINVVDSTAPNLTLPPDITVNCEYGGTTVDLGSPVFSDTCSDVSIIAPNSPTVLTAGEHTFGWSAGDDSGNVTLAAQTVTVVDNIPPTPQNAWFINENCTAKDTPASDINLDRFRDPVYISDNCDDDILITNDAPETFPIGETTVTWTMTDNAGNTFQRSHLVRIFDSLTYQIPPDVTVVVDSVNSCPGTQVVFGYPTISNQCETPVLFVNSINYNIIPGQGYFEVGTHEVIWSSVDIWDPEGVLTYRGTQTVTLLDPEGLCDFCPNDPDNDIDGDEICGDIDNCPAVSNPDQADNDLDNLGDACDPDDDNDGLTDEQEAAAGTDPFNHDTDGDTVGDAGDVCPLEDATGFDADMNGCIDTLAGITDTLDTLVAEGVIDSTLQNSLVTKVAGAEKAADKENICAAINKLGALKNEVNAQAGKKISHEAAALVTNYTNNLITQLLNQLPEGATC